MRLLIEAAMIFFGTLLVAALLALGEPLATLHAAAGDGLLPMFAPAQATAAGTPDRR